MNIATGCDLVQISKLSTAIQQKHLVLDKLFSKNEQQNLAPEHLAGIFAAKEAALKALKLKPGTWLDIEIQKNPDGSPHLTINNAKIADVTDKISLSISHDGDYALAIVIAVLK